METDLVSVQLRDYQLEAVEAVERAHARGIRRSLVVLPTGTGKTVVFAELIRRRQGRALILAHREELLEQAGDKLRLVSPGLDIGIVKAERDEHQRPVVVASVQTLARDHRISRLERDFRTLVVDEAHHSTARTYRGVLAQLGGFAAEGGPLVLGVTATPERADGVGLTHVWEEVVYRRDLLDMMQAGYLCELRALRIKVAVDLDAMSVRGGDYDDSELADAMTRANAPEHALAAYKEHGEDRKTLIFTPSVDLAHAMAEVFTGAGIAAAAIDGSALAEQRASTLAAFRAGEIQVLANCALLTEGFDEPSVGCLILARPTQSRPLYMQMLGRGTRRAPDKTDCLVIDLVGSSERHDLITLPDLVGLEPERLDGQHVTTAIRQRDEELADPERSPAGGRLEAEQVDLFSGRQFHWSCGEGVFVLPGGNQGQVVLRETSSGWRVSELHAGGDLRVLAEDLDLGYAQGLAEDTVRRWGASRLARADAPWRSQTASERQLALLARKGLRPDPGITKGEAADLLTVAFATSALAPATANQRRFLEQLGVEAPGELTKTEAGALIGRALKQGARR